jgi:hypothetical protein
VYTHFSSGSPLLGGFNGPQIKRSFGIVRGGEAVGEDLMKNRTLERFRQIHGSMTLTLLQNKCLTTGSEYVELTKESCALLVQLKEVPIPESMRNEIFYHRRRELVAHAAYSKARSLLWDFLTDFTPHRNNNDVMETSKNREVNVTEASEMAKMSGAS